MNNFCKLIFVTLILIFFACPATDGASNPSITSQNTKALQKLKIDFDSRVSKNQDCTDLFVRLAAEVSTNNSDEVVRFLLDLSKKHKRNIISISSDKKIQNEVIFKYLEYASTPKGIDRVAIHEDIYNQTPSIKLLLSLIKTIALQSFSIHKDADPQIFYDKFRVYLAEYNSSDGRNSETDYIVTGLAGQFWYLHNQYGEAIPFYKELVSSENESAYMKNYYLATLIQCYVNSKNFSDAELSINIYGPRLGNAWVQYKTTDTYKDIEAKLYSSIADQHKDAAEYQEAIDYYLKVPTIGTFLPQHHVWLMLRDCYYEITKANRLTDELLNKLLESKSIEIKVAGLAGISDAKWEADKYDEAYSYLKKQAAYYSSIEKPHLNLVDVLFENDLYFMLGYCASKSGDSWEAVRAYKKIPNNVNAQYNLALIWIGNPAIRSKRNAMEVIQKVKLLDKEKYNILMDNYEEAFENNNSNKSK